MAEAARAGKRWFDAVRPGTGGAIANRSSHLRVIRDYVGEANPEGYIILYYRMVAVGSVIIDKIKERFG
ncbi:MAG: hypothetical protein PHP26_01690 [Syntrophomonas sp.]|nr:hypothetical protein [Syntrophomonas sp.]MDD3878685.1 hypothetical protein [Syntrophomonas sp.]